MPKKKPVKKAKTGSKARKTDEKGALMPHRAAEPLPVKLQALIIVFILLVSLALLYPELVFQDKIFLAQDVEAAVSFAKAAHRVMIAEHIYPLWNPYLFAGMPSYESLAYNPYVYPLSFVTGFLIRGLHFPPNTWLLFHAFLLGLGVFLLLRQRAVSFIASASAAVFMMWMPNLVAIGANGHGSQACAIAYIPYALLFWDRINMGKGIWLNGSALAIVLGFQMLRAHLQISYYTYALIGLHFLFFSVVKLVDALRGIKPREFALPSMLMKKLDSGTGSATRYVLSDIGVLALALILVAVFSLLMSSVLYVPVHEYAKYSIRGASESGGLDYGYATSWSLHPIESLTFIIPFSFGFGKSFYFGYMPFTDYPNYLGLVTVLFSLIAVAFARTRFVKFLIFLVAASTLVAFGKYFPILYKPLFDWMPFFNKFRVPVMVLIIQQFAFVALFAFGFDALVKLKEHRGLRISKIALFAFAGILFLSLATRGYWENGFAKAIAGRMRVGTAQQHTALAGMAGQFLFGDLVKFALIGIALSGLSFLYFKKITARYLFVGLVLFISILDLYSVDRYITHPEKLVRSDQLKIIKSEKVIDDYLKPDPVVDFLKKDEGFYRIFPLSDPRRPFSGDFGVNRYMIFGISSIGGYHAAKLSSYNSFLEALGMTLVSGNFQLLDMLNTRYVITAFPLAQGGNFRLVWKGPDHRGQTKYIYENAEAFPRVFFVDKYLISKGDEARKKIQDRNLDLRTTAVLAERPAIEPVSREGSTAKITKFSFNEIHVQARTKSPCIMVLSEIYYPRWKVTVDGMESKILKADYILRAVALPAGDHKLVFKYDSSHIRKSFHISLYAFSVTLLVLILSIVMKGNWRWKRL